MLFFLKEPQLKEFSGKLEKLVLPFFKKKKKTLFRVPAFPNEVKQLKEQINLGNYHLFSIATNVHTIAALMKLWLRELTDPLIPNHY